LLVDNSDEYEKKKKKEGGVYTYGASSHDIATPPSHHAVL
jgi:hypothetical protein